MEADRLGGLRAPHHPESRGSSSAGGGYHGITSLPGVTLLLQCLREFHEKMGEHETSVRCLITSFKNLSHTAKICIWKI